MKLNKLSIMDLMPHLAGIVTSIIVVAGVGTASNAFHGGSPAEARTVPGRAYSATENGSLGDIRILLQIAASQALDSNPGVVVAYDANRICKGLAASAIEPEPKNASLGLATYYPEVDELIVKRQVSFADLRAVCAEGNIPDNQVFVSDKNMRLSSDRTVSLQGDLVGIPDS